jgi:adenylate cyclase
LTDARVERRLAAILAADVVGFSALMERDEEGTYARVGRLRREIIEPRLSDHQGRLIKTTGDGFLAEFASPIAALRCALAIQGSSSNAPDALRLRIGLNLGDVIIEEGGDVYGEGVNVAARLEALADADGILISDKIHREVEGKVEAAFEDRGEQQVKNITRPIRIYAVRSAGAASTSAATSASQFDPGKPLPLPDKPSIAVLPFQNMSGDPEQEYFADGVVEDIITALSRFKSLFVIARNSSFTYKGKAADIKQVGRELGVRYVLEGSVRKAGGKVRITGQLIEVSTGTHLWADRFGGAIEDMFDLQDKVTEQVIGALMPTMRRAEIERLKLKRTESLGAYDYFTRALSHYNQRSTTDAYRTEIDLCYKAIKADPNFANAYSLAAVLFVRRNNYRLIVDRKVEVAEGLRLARQAVDLGRDDPENLARAGLAIGNLGDDTERERGLALLDQAIDMNSNLVDAWNSSGWGQIFMGSLERGRENLLQALRLSPSDPLKGMMLAGIGTANFLLGEDEQAFSWADRAFMEDPVGLFSQRIFAITTAKAGQIDKAQEAVRRLIARVPSETLAVARRHYEREMRWKPQEKIERIIDGLRLAGLPE